MPPVLLDIIEKYSFRSVSSSVCTTNEEDNLVSVVGKRIHPHWIKLGFFLNLHQLIGAHFSEALHIDICMCVNLVGEEVK